MLIDVIRKVSGGEDLTEEEMFASMGEIMDGRATPAQIAALLTALKIKGETVEEITGAARAMRMRSIKIPLSDGGGGGSAETLVDTCGTGGDGSGTFNVSTVSAIVVAGTGLRVAKHGNRSISSRCGSADLMEALGVPLELSPRHVAECIERVGMGFLFAPNFHPAIRHAMAPRREIGIRTIFNLLGPLCNPAGAGAQLIGVADPDMVEKLAGVLLRLRCPSAVVVHGQGGLDELSTLGTNKIARVSEGSMVLLEIVPEDVGLRRASLNELKGGDVERNAAIAMGVLNGLKGACRDMVLLNAAAAIWAAGAAPDLKEGVAMAAQSIDSGRALSKLKELASFASMLAGQEKT
jgi:anthranilate phosphoribosyltransferase